MSKFDNGLFVIDFILNKLKILLYFNLKSKIYSLREKVKYINVKAEINTYLSWNKIKEKVICI